MSPSKVRIYDLAKELKLESKRIIEEARREGADVSVPSNTLSKDLAEKIRNKYFPKKEAFAPRTVRVVKKSARPGAPEEVVSDAHEATATSTASTAPPPSEKIIHDSPSATDQQAATAKSPVAARLIKRLAPAVRADRPMSTTPPAVQEAQPESMIENQLPTASAAPTAVPYSAATAPDSPAIEALPPAEEQVWGADEPPAMVPQTPFSGGSITTTSTTNVRQLRLTPQALSAGLRQGERAPVMPPATPSAPASRERGGRREERTRPGVSVMERGTPGETATPQVVYTPPADARRPRSRAGARRTRGGKVVETKNTRFERDFVPPPKALTLEERIIDSLPNASSGSLSSSTTLRPVRLVEGSTIKEFAEKLGIKPKDIVALLMQRGMFPTINQPLTDEVAADLGKRFGYEVAFVPFEAMVAEEEFEDLIAADADDVEVERAPVVTVMGHVDHGKTSLLDSIRTTDVAAGEAGGITQHIGAYSVHVPDPDDPGKMRRIVFLDTPGHEAFTMMRARGAKATDIVVLVVAADDGVMPQTVEAIEHARAANVPIVVAINKIDRPDANPDRVKQQLANLGLQPVDWGGDTEMVSVSAKQRENIDNLLETVLLTADILNLRASPTRLAAGVVLEAKLDRGRGAVATVLVQQGALHVGDPFIIGQIFGKVRAMFNDRGETVAEAGPATPVEVLGLQGMPQAGETFQVVADVTRAQQISHQRQVVSRQNTLVQTTKRGIEALGEAEVKELLVVLKADVQGSVEVLKSTLQKLSTERVKVRVIRSGVGAITESDVLLASATQAGASNTAVVIIGFNVRPEVRAAELAKQEAVDVRLHSIIYKVEEEIRAAMLGMLEAIEQERILGRADVREVFRVPKLGAVAGCMVRDGLIRRTARARLIRDSVVAWEGNIASLRRFKDDAAEVREGFECGIGLENFNDIKVGDQIEAYVIDKVAATEL